MSIFEWKILPRLHQISTCYFIFLLMSLVGKAASNAHYNLQNNVVTETWEQEGLYVNTEI